MANKYNDINNLPKFPKFLQQDKVQLTQGQANELLGNKPQLRGEIPDATSQLTPMQRYSVAQILGLPDTYKPVQPQQRGELEQTRLNQILNLYGQYSPEQYTNMLKEENNRQRRINIVNALMGTNIKPTTSTPLKAAHTSLALKRR